MASIAPLQIKIPLLENYVFSWWLPGVVDLADDFSITLKSGSTTVSPDIYAMYEGNVAVTAIADDLRTLTIDPGEDPVILPAGGLVGLPFGRALLSSTSHGDLPVTVIERISNTSVKLADPLPRGVNGTVDFRLNYTGIRTFFTPETITGSVGKWALRMSYSYARRGEASAEAGETVTGVVKVVRQPFCTGLSHHSLLTSAIWMSSQVPRAQQSWEPQIHAARGILERWLRETLADVRTGADEDSVNGAAYHDVHAWLTAYLVLQSQVQMGVSKLAEARDEALKMARTEYDRLNRNIPWVDLNADGVIDSGETDINLANSVSGRVGGLFSASNPRFTNADGSRFRPQFRRGMSH